MYNLHNIVMCKCCVGIFLPDLDPHFQSYFLSI